MHASKENDMQKRIYLIDRDAEQESNFVEFAGRSVREAVALARAHGYTMPDFTEIRGNFCVIRFKRHPAQQVA